MQQVLPIWMQQFKLAIGLRKFAVLQFFNLMMSLKNDVSYLKFCFLNAMTSLGLEHLRLAWQLLHSTHSLILHNSVPQ